MADEKLPMYHESLRADVQTQVSDSPVAKVHRVEWQKVMSGEPVEINPSVGQGYRVMSVDEWAARWKRNDDFPLCLKCEGTNTKEHYFTQVSTAPAVSLTVQGSDTHSLVLHDIREVQ
jgi:hypothetical protein